jgi:hypothetical protein
VAEDQEGGNDEQGKEKNFHVDPKMRARPPGANPTVHFRPEATQVHVSVSRLQLLDFG